MPVSAMFQSGDRNKLLKYLSKRKTLELSSIPSQHQQQQEQPAKVSKDSTEKFNDMQKFPKKISGLNFAKKAKISSFNENVSNVKSFDDDIDNDSGAVDNQRNKRKSNSFIVTELLLPKESKPKKTKTKIIRTKEDEIEDQLKQDVHNLLSTFGNEETDEFDHNFQKDLGDDQEEKEEEVLGIGNKNKKGKQEDVARLRSEQLASKARQTLANSMFRSMNEFLYSNQSGEARNCFTENKFHLYHQAYEKIVGDWPVKPVDFLIDVLKKRIKPNQMSSVVIGDIGCGNRPQIAMAFPEATVHSYDLYSSGPSLPSDDCQESNYSIISADMSRLPLDNEQCDYLVYSLSLMPVNLRDCLYEANRVLKPNGYMMVVEVASRFQDYQPTSKSSKIAIEKHCGHRFTADLRQFGFQLTRHEMLPPNGYFVFFSLKKCQQLQGKIPKATLPPMTLKACVYKAR